MDCSDKHRRSMSQALRTAELGEEARAFVAGKTTLPSAEAPPPATSKPAIGSPEGDSVARARARNGVPNPNLSEKRPAVEGIVSITVRLPASLPPRLLRASVERKLQRKQPFTQQDIVTAALQQWLAQNGERE